MQMPKFEVGDRVVVRPQHRNQAHRPGIYVIKRVLPLERSVGYTYHAKSDLDAHQRIFSEIELLNA